MKNFEQVEYIKKYSLVKSPLEAERPSREDPQLRKIIKDLKLISKQIKAYKRNSRKWWVRKLRKNRGCIYLFEGSKGAGKTLTTEIVLRGFQNDTYRIDLGIIVNKYLGETEKILDQLFDTAESQNWILFFDEADALFGKRTDISDAHARFSNQETNFLLERIAKFKGIVILSINARNRFDKAFTRRIQRIIDLSVLKDEEEE